jgi:DNA sulfur modification protein DndD
VREARLVEDPARRVEHHRDGPAEVVVVTEIAEEYYELLEGDLAREYHLQQQEETGRTKITPGYFWTVDESETDSGDVETSVDRQAELPFNNE